MFLFLQFVEYCHSAYSDSCFLTCLLVLILPILVTTLATLVTTFSTITLVESGRACQGFSLQTINITICDSKPPPTFLSWSVRSWALVNPWRPPGPPWHQGWPSWPLTPWYSETIRLLVWLYVVQDMANVQLIYDMGVYHRKFQDTGFREMLLN